MLFLILNFVRVIGTVTTTEFWSDYCWHRKTLNIYINRNRMVISFYPASLNAVLQGRQKAMYKTLMENKSQEGKASGNSVLE